MFNVFVWQVNGLLSGVVLVWGVCCAIVSCYVLVCFVCVVLCDVV